MEATEPMRAMRGMQPAATVEQPSPRDAAASAAPAGSAPAASRAGRPMRGELIGYASIAAIALLTFLRAFGLVA